MTDTEILTECLKLFVLPGLGIGAGLCAMAWLIGYAIAAVYDWIRRS